MQKAPEGSRRSARITEIVENVVGCKWTLHVLAQVRGGVTRPGRLVRTAEGLTTKVLNERLAKLVRYGVLEKVSRTLPCGDWARARRGRPLVRRALHAQQCR